MTANFIKSYIQFTAQQGTAVISCHAPAFAYLAAFFKCYGLGDPRIFISKWCHARNATRKSMTPTFLRKRDWEVVNKARAIILEDLKKHYTIRELARRLYVNEFKLKTSFRQAFGIGIFQYLLHARMEMAKDLLLEGDLPMKRIAADVGYKNTGSFIKSFRKYFGCTPALMRRSCPLL